jgi:hypothetical protein
MRNISGVMKTSSVMISTGDEPTFYRSVQEVPEPLRSRLIESTHGSNSGTIVIADRAGKDQITQVIARRENARERKATGKGVHKEMGKESGKVMKDTGPIEEAPAERHWHSFLAASFLGFRLAAWAGLLLFLAAIMLIVAAFLVH